MNDEHKTKAQLIAELAEVRQHVIELEAAVVDHQQLDAALLASETRYRRLFETAQDGILLLDATTGQITDANPFLVTMLGYSHAEFVGKHLWEIGPFKDVVDSHLAFEQLQTNDYIRYEDLPLETRDGQRVDVEFVSNVYRVNGVRVIQCNVRDITARRRAEITLKDSEERLREVLQSKIITLHALTEIDREITAATEATSILKLVCRHAAELARAPKSMVIIRTAAAEMELTASYGLRDAARASAEFAHAWQTGLMNLSVLKTRGAIVRNDIPADTHAMPETISAEGVRAFAIVPLVPGQEVLGALIVLDTAARQWLADDLQVFRTLASQAALALEKLRLFQAAQNRALYLATLYRIGQAINSTLDADTILDRLTDEAMRVTHATRGSALVARPDRGCFERRSLRGYSPEQTAAARTAWLSLDHGVKGRAYRSRQTVYVADAQIDPADQPLLPDTHSELAVPIIHDGQAIGNLDLQSTEVDAFREVDLDFLRALTDQVAIALENARLFGETRRRMDEMSVVSQVALIGTASRPVDETITRATDALSRLWPEASVGVWFVDAGGQTLRLHLAHDSAAPVSVPVESGLTGWVVRERQPVRVGDVAADPRHFLTRPGRRSEMAAPLLVGQRVMGVVDVTSPWADAFSGEDLRFLITLAGQLTTIFEKARLDAELIAKAALIEQRTQERLAEILREQARIQAILDALGEAVVVADLQGTIQYVNQAMERVTGYNAQESIGQSLRQRQTGQTPDEIYEALWATVLAGQTWRGEIVNRRKDGELYSASLVVAPIPATRHQAEPLAGFVGIQRDISELKRAEAEMRRALDKEKELNNLKSNFVSLTSHEFRTPLTTILSSAEMLEYYGAGWAIERQHEHLHRIQAAVKNMTTLLNDILIVGKAEAGKLEFRPAPLDRVKFCRDLVDELRLTDRAEHVLIFNSQVECGPTRLDEILLRHILSNLLSNALKYSPPGSAVQFDLICQADQTLFQITDQGLGIPPEDQLHLFEVFHRASNVRHIAGTGLGMAIVKKSVDLHGGTIEVTSQVGAGTIVTVRLPIHGVSAA